ncbi:two-component system response regulator YesN [Paenibacillus sp. V4I3]|uniref:response regulator transcription factor n=1 Tax=unclassified Paenibacillus TaxID=185978 RepID=UPI00278462D7|nr:MULTISPECIES: response regulator [unclassified Paenibacillus]MDQ0873628.1 two-component system response regulator YesN [Paenibacillus sp. V4I3]MDQ0890442.1 two-component system response regulator YesN [Paenibacillus sp. V4I9]
MFTVLIVDDEANVRLPMCRTLSRFEGVGEVLDASSGLEAITILKQRTVQLVITDIRMPAGDGLQLAEYIRQHSRQTDVYVLTGHAEFDYAMKAMQHQVAAYLLKPLSKEKLLEVYNEAYGKYRRRMESEQVNVIRSRALLEKRMHDLLHGVPVPTFDEGLIPRYATIRLVSFSTKDLRSLGETSVRYFIRECAHESFSGLGTAAVCEEDRLITVVLFTEYDDKGAWEQRVQEISKWMEAKLRIEVKTGHGGCTREISDLGLMYMRSMMSLGFNEITRKERGDSFPPIIKALLKYVHNEYANEAANLSDFAQQFQVNANYLSNLFHQEMGLTYTQYLTQIRLTEAKRWLRETNLKVYEVCIRVGYKDPAYFSRIFKTFVGMAPGDYRTVEHF